MQRGQSASASAVHQPCNKPFLHQVCSSNLGLVMSHPSMLQGKGKQRLMRRDFAGENRRENKWSEENKDKPRQDRSAFLNTADLDNSAFEEYYKGQVSSSSNPSGQIPQSSVGSLLHYARLQLAQPMIFTVPVLSCSVCCAVLCCGCRCAGDRA